MAEVSTPVNRSGDDALGRSGRVEPRPWGRLWGMPKRVMAVGVVVALSGWAAAAWEHFVVLPRAMNTSKVAYALQLVDQFDDTAGHLAYVQLSSDLKPWWDEIEPLQRRLQEAKDDEARDGLIAERDASLIVFLRDRGLVAKVDLLVSSYDVFNRCLASEACDGETIQRAIAIDVKRIWRTFRPWILEKRASGKAEDKDFGRPLEELYFRFVG